MSQENLEVVRRFIEALPRAQASGDWQPVLAEVDADVEIEDLDISLDTAHFRGHDSVRKWIGVWMENWESWRHESVLLHAFWFELCARGRLRRGPAARHARPATLPLAP